MVAKSLLVLLMLVACTSVPRSDRAIPDLNYWEALAGLDVDRAIAVARTSAEKQFAESLKSLMVGDIEKAEQGFDALRRLPSDPVIRAGARLMYIASLQYQEKWTELAQVAPDSARSNEERPNKASIQQWARAFTGIPPKRSDFRRRSEELPMSVSAVGTPLIRVHIAGRLFHFWLDTGSSMTILASDVARSLGINPLVSDTLEIVTSTGRIAAQPALIPMLRLGNLVVRNVPTMVVDETTMRMRESEPTGQRPQLKIDGIIGFDIIRWLDIEVDYIDLVLKLRDPAHSEMTRDRNMFWVGLPVVRFLSTNGIPLHFALDTGAQLTFVTENLLDKLQLQATRMESRTLGGLGGELSVRAPVLSDLRLRLRGFRIVVRSVFVRAPVYQVLVALDGVLGGDIWSAGVVRMDVTNGVFAVKPDRQ
jgi:clan AA aspartic protease (TIGR02281 family)